MKSQVRLKEYLSAQLGKEYFAVSMQELMRPFEVEAMGDADANLTIGAITESLATEFKRDDFIDPIDVAAAAYSLGYEEAAYFLDETPWLSPCENHKSERDRLLN